MIIGVASDNFTLSASEVTTLRRYTNLFIILLLLAEVRSIVIIPSVCLSVRCCVSKATHQIAAKFSVDVALAVVRSSSEDDTLCNVLPVWGMTSRYVFT